MHIICGIGMFSPGLYAVFVEPQGGPEETCAKRTVRHRQESSIMSRLGKIANRLRHCNPHLYGIRMIAGPINAVQ